MTRKLDINLHDTSIGIWQDDANDPTFRAEIFGPLIRSMRDRGWTIGAGPTVHYAILRPTHRLGKRGNLRAELRCSGRAVEVKFWSEAAPSENRNGPRYGFDHRKNAPYLDRLRFDLETCRILAWLGDRAEITLKRPPRAGTVAPGAMSAMDFIAENYRTSWHADKELGRPVAKCDSNRISCDGETIQHGHTVWFADQKGRIRCGTAYYNINNMWWIVSGEWSLSNKATHEIYTRQPVDLRKKLNERRRRGRLEAELALAIRSMKFLRAETLRKILFGRELTYGIWAKDHGAFYRSNYSGYTTDSIAAGRYTWDEAADEVRRCPDGLRLVTPDGSHLSASDLGMARAA